MAQFHISQLLEVLFENKVFKGTFSIPQTMINRDFKMELMDKIDAYVDDYKVTFDSGAIFLQTILHLNQLGKINAAYQFTIKEFTFHNGTHTLLLTYFEDVKSQGNVMQSMALKAAGMKGSYLKTALEFAGNSNNQSQANFIRSAITVTDTTLSINLDRLNFIKQIPPSLGLTYVSCEDGILKLSIS